MGRGRKGLAHGHIQGGHKRSLIGGPWAGELAYIGTETLIITVGKWHGRYINGRWVDNETSSEL